MIGWIIGAIGAVVALFWVRNTGRINAEAKEAAKDAAAVTELHTRIDHAQADAPTDADDARQRLRDRADRGAP